MEDNCFDLRVKLYLDKGQPFSINTKSMPVVSDVRIKVPRFLDLEFYQLTILVWLG